MKRFEFKFKDRVAHFRPMLYFRKKRIESKLREPSSQRGKYGHDDATTFGTVGEFTGPAAFANFGFGADVVFASIVGGLDRGMLDKNEQALQVVGQFVL